MDFDALNVAKVYNQARRMPPQALRIWQRAILKYLPKTDIASLLDLGCGSGRFEPFLRQMFPKAKIFGIEPAKDMLAEAKKSFTDPNTEFLAGRAEQIPLGNEAVETVFLSMVFHTFEDRAKALGEIRRVLKPGGCVIVR